ncbi:MAG: hypothetical protein QMD11_11250 [Smithella sp.]|nr:hypothetical protein [Smithella sp.]
MRKSILFTVFVAFLAGLFLYGTEVWADCGSDCARECAHHGSGKDYAACVQNCLKGCLDNDPPAVPPVPEPKPVKPSESKSDLKNFNSNMYVKAENEKTDSIIIASSSYDDLDQPCYVGGKYVGNCSRNKPYYNAFNGQCYETLNACGGSSSCVRCGK